MFYHIVLLLTFLIQSKGLYGVFSVGQKSLMTGLLKDHQLIGEPKCMFLWMLSLKKWKERLWVLMCKHHCVTKCKRDFVFCASLCWKYSLILFLKEKHEGCNQQLLIMIGYHLHLCLILQTRFP